MLCEFCLSLKITCNLIVYKDEQQYYIFVRIYDFLCCIFNMFQGIEPLDFFGCDNGTDFKR